MSKKFINPNQQMADMAAQAAKRLPMGKQIGGQKPEIDPEIIKQGEDMTCLNQIPQFDPETGQPIEGKTQTCRGNIFVDAFKMKYVSPIMSPVGMQTIGYILLGKVCAKCGKVFNPDEWLKDRNQKKQAVKGTVLDKGA